MLEVGASEGDEVTLGAGLEGVLDGEPVPVLLGLAFGLSVVEGAEDVAVVTPIEAAGELDVPGFTVPWLDVASLVPSVDGPELSLPSDPQLESRPNKDNIRPDQQPHRRTRLPHVSVEMLEELVGLGCDVVIKLSTYQDPVTLAAMGGAICLQAPP